MNTAPRPYRLSPLERSMGVLVGPDPDAVPIPRAPQGQSARGALEAVVLRALQKPPCVVSFSGGRDSSAILAVAAHVARREGLPLPLPVTLRFPDVERADETSWQELVVGHLALVDWQKVVLSDEIDVVGPYAQRVLRRYGLLWPMNAHFHLPIAEFAPGGSVMSGAGGDELLSTSWEWHRVNMVLTRRVKPRWKDVVRVIVAAGPPLVRRRFLLRQRRRGSATSLSWLLPDAADTVARMKLEAAARAPVRWDDNVRLSWWPSLYRRVANDSFGLVAREGGASLALSPLRDGVFLDAVARERGRGGFTSRTEGMECLVGDLLPRVVLERSTKSSFDQAFWNRHARATAEQWGGSGVDPAIVDLETLGRMWRDDGPDSDARSWMLLQSAWLAQHDAARANVVSERRPQSGQP